MLNIMYRQGIYHQPDIFMTHNFTFNSMVNFQTFRTFREDKYNIHPIHWWHDLHSQRLQEWGHKMLKMLQGNLNVYLWLQLSFEHFMICQTNDSVIVLFLNANKNLQLSLFWQSFFNWSSFTGALISFNSFL